LKLKTVEKSVAENGLIRWVEVHNKVELKVGYIIIYKHPTSPGLDNVAHRIIEVKSNGGYRFRTQGDNLFGPDRHWVPEGNLQGLVIGEVYVVPK